MIIIIFFLTSSFYYLQLFTIWFFLLNFLSFYIILSDIRHSIVLKDEYRYYFSFFLYLIRHIKLY